MYSFPNLMSQGMVFNLTITYNEKGEIYMYKQIPLLYT